MSSMQPIWQGKLSRVEAIRLIEQISEEKDEGWFDLMEDFHDEESDTFPSLSHVFAALGVTREEYIEATGANPAAVTWPEQ